MIDIFNIIRETTLGIHAKSIVTSLSGGVKPRVRTYLDSAATCLAIKPVVDAEMKYLEASCANSHTKATVVGRDTTEQLHYAHGDLGALVGFDPIEDSVIFIGSGTTAAACFVADAIHARDHKPFAVVSSLEHHSNLLPWQRHFELLYVKCLTDGQIDMDHLREILASHCDRVCVVAVTAVSNVTGVMPPLGEIAAVAHKAGAMLFVDAAQGAAHIPIDKKMMGIDILVGSGHKMYAPGSPGWIVASRSFFKGLGWKAGATGGGAVDRVELQRVWLKDDPSERYEAGTPNIPGSIALGAAARLLRHIGMERVLTHERDLVQRCIDGLQTVNGVVIYGPLDASLKTSVVAFNLDDVPHGIVSAALSDFFGIMTRNDCFCAQPYVRQLVHGLCKTQGLCKPTQAGKTGMVRASFGLYSNDDDVQALIMAMRWISTNRSAILPLYEETSEGSWENKSFRGSTGYDYRQIVAGFIGR